MTALVARQPLHPLSMSSSQRGPRRLSARLQEKDDTADGEQQGRLGKGPHAPTKAQPSAAVDGKKRKNDYDEDDDGFAFTRVKKKSRTSEGRSNFTSHGTKNEVSAPVPQPTTSKVPISNGESIEPPKKKRNKMSFSTPNPKELKPVRRSKRLSSENENNNGSPVAKSQQTVEHSGTERTLQKKGVPRQPEHRVDLDDAQQLPSKTTHEDGDKEHSGTKIALPFADTPVIRRNKAMREGKGGKGERRSSLGLRGRRASSLIESGNSNALPHHEVDVADYFKHIESEGLPEPRRMRQLLTWCATRSLDEKPMGTDFEEASARSAARVIQEELLKDLANQSELSDWFTREDMPVQPKVLPEKPNPKNLQNAVKITELEEQIRRLRAERDSLEALLRPPEIPDLAGAKIPELAKVDTALLCETDVALLASLNAESNLQGEVSKRVNSIQTSLRPSVDAFADGVHKMAQYRNTADNVAGRVLAVCSEKLAERERDERKKALPQDNGRSPQRDLSSVLRGLSRVDR